MRIERQLHKYNKRLLITGGKRMFLLVMLILVMLLLIKGFFKFVLPALIILMIFKFLFGGLMLLFSPHFWGTLLVIAFIVWLVRASRSRYY